MLVAITVISALGVFLPRKSWAAVVPIALLFPLLLWLAARCQPMFARSGRVHHCRDDRMDDNFRHWVFRRPQSPDRRSRRGRPSWHPDNVLCTLVLAALFAERREHEAALSEVAARLEEALAAGAVMAFDWDTRTGLSHPADAAGVLGYDPQIPLTTTRFLALIHPDDRAHFKAHVESVRPDKPSYAVEFRVVRPDGREMWLEETATAEFDAAGNRIRIKGLTLDITERKRADEHKRLLVAELDHRVKNVLHASASLPCTHDRAAPRWTSLSKPLISAFKAWQLPMSLSRNKWQGVRVADLLSATNWLPMRRSQTRRLAGPTSRSPLPQLKRWRWCCTRVTNASKYGALSIPEGGYQ